MIQSEVCNIGYDRESARDSLISLSLMNEMEKMRALSIISLPWMAIKKKSKKKWSDLVGGSSKGSQKISSKNLGKKQYAPFGPLYGLDTQTLYSVWI
jgi:hypothetical protein